jgi:hypothetical protein
VHPAGGARRAHASVEQAQVGVEQGSGADHDDQQDHPEGDGVAAVAVVLRQLQQLGHHAGAAVEDGERADEGDDRRVDRRRPLLVGVVVVAQGEDHQQRQHEDDREEQGQHRPEATQQEQTTHVITPSGLSLVGRPPCPG